jgi:RNA polymerase sigma-70 factor (ECF subfamily)
VIDEKLLVTQLKQTETQEQAFRKLMSLYKKRLYWHIRKIVLSHDDADDVLQNTFIKVFKNIHAFKEDSKLYSWMYRIATNEAITFINKKAAMQKVDLSELQYKIVDDLHNDVYYSGDEIQQLLQKAIVTLPQKQQLVFNMKYFDEMKYSDISEILDTSVGALKASFFHAVKKIEKFLKSH